jgi:hypothetical protein
MDRALAPICTSLLAASIDLNQSCWDAWAAEDLGQMQRACNERPDGRHWWTPESAPGIGWFAKNGERWAAIWQKIDGRWTWIGGMSSPEASVPEM